MKRKLDIQTLFKYSRTFYMKDMMIDLNKNRFRPLIKLVMDNSLKLYLINSLFLKIAKRIQLLLKEYRTLERQNFVIFLSLYFHLKIMSSYKALTLELITEKKQLMITPKFNLASFLSKKDSMKPL